MDVALLTWQDKLLHSEHLVSFHTRKSDRQKQFFKRQIDRKQVCVDQLREELNAAKQKVAVTERGTRKVERQLHVDQADVDREKKNLNSIMARQFGKMQSLLATTRDQRVQNAEKIVALRLARIRRESFLLDGNLV
jgi:hypothetical protein